MQYNIKHESGTEAYTRIQVSIDITIFNMFILKCIGLYII